MYEPTPQHLIDELEAFMCHIEALFYQLANRWAKEQKPETLADCAAMLRPHLPEGWSITQMVDHPFGFNFTIPDMPGALYRIYAAGHDYYGRTRLR
jgi:hypothetical protein